MVTTIDPELLHRALCALVGHDIDDDAQWRDPQGAVCRLVLVDEDSVDGGVLIISRTSAARVTTASAYLATEFFGETLAADAALAIEAAMAPLGIVARTRALTLRERWQERRRLRESLFVAREGRPQSCESI